MQNNTATASSGVGGRRKSRVQVHSILTAVSSSPTVPRNTAHHLTVVDHSMSHHTLHAIFYYKENPFTSFDLDPLKVCLSEVLSMYPPVTGRLRRGDEGKWEVNCNDAGVRLLRAKVGVGIDEWLRSGGGEERDLTVWEEMPKDPSTWSPFRIQINEFEGGGIAIGLSCTHMLADPTSVTLLFKTWTEAHLRQPTSHPPSFSPHPHTLTATNAVSPKTSAYLAIKSETQTATPSTKSMATATFKFSGSAFEKCLEEIRGDFPDATPFDVFAALFWTRVLRTKRKKQDDSDRTQSLVICLDFRRLLKRPLPYGYFGNALHFSSLSLKPDEMDFKNVAWSINRHVAGIDDSEVQSAIDWLESRNRDHGGKYLQPVQMYGPDLTCVNMQHMMADDQPLMYLAFFEKGARPVHVSYHVGNAEGEGLVMVMPSPEGGFGRTVAVTLPEEELAKLLVDEEILRLEPKILLSGGTGT